MKLLVLNGPNINMLGIREPEIYGKEDYKALVKRVTDFGESRNVDIEVYQSNHEGDLVDKIQASLGVIDGIVFNPGAYTHTSVAILDAVKAVNIPTIEVHITDPDEREDFRKVSFIRLAAVKTIKGKGIDGYIEALEYFVNGK